MLEKFCLFNIRIWPKDQAKKVRRRKDGHQLGAPENQTNLFPNDSTAMTESKQQAKHDQLGAFYDS